MNSRLLLVEPSATMRYVLENYAQSLGFTVVAIGDYKLAEEALHQQFRSYGDDFAGVMLGWPIVSDTSAESLISTLEGSDYSDMPVIVMSTDMRAETRAWVAGREHTSVLNWKEYQSVDELLQKLLQQSMDDSDTFTSKFNNTDINVLIVDDSVSIRYAMQDLFELQGYSVSVASGHDEAITMAQKSAFDIAIIDFYLQGGTGDALCRRLITDPATGQITCAMLTGTYADHIIKRSLRAGAVECMFKNESSELLLARVDALARFVRQRKSIATQQRQLDTLVDSLAGATIVIDSSDKLSYASEQACRLLGYDSRASLLAQASNQVVDLDKIKESAPGKYRAIWRDMTQKPVNVIYRQILLVESDEVVVNFKRLPASTQNAAAQGDAAQSDATQSKTEQSGAAIEATSTQASDDLAISVAKLVEELKLPTSSLNFVSILSSALTTTNDASDLTSLLVLDTFVAESEKEFRPSNEFAQLTEVLESELKQVYRRVDHVAHLGKNRYGFLLKHSTDPQAYLLTRKIMQLCNSIDIDQRVVTINCTGCLVSVSANKAKDPSQLIQLANQGMDVVNQRGINQALLLDLKRMLPVYASQNND